MMYKKINHPKLSLYSISRSGVIINNETGKVRKTNRDKYGYVRVSLHHVAYRIHTLVALTYIGDCPEGCQVNHKDKNKENNNVENLEWITLFENIKHKCLGEFNSPYSKILCYKGDDFVKEYNYVFEVEADGFRKTNVSDALHGRQKTVKGYRFIGIK